MCIEELITSQDPTEVVESDSETQLVKESKPQRARELDVDNRGGLSARVAPSSSDMLMMGSKAFGHKKQSTSNNTFVMKGNASITGTSIHGEGSLSSRSDSRLSGRKKSSVGNAS